MAFPSRSPRTAASSGPPESFLGSVGDLLAGLLFVCLLLAAAGPMLRPEATPTAGVAAAPKPADVPLPAAATEARGRALEEIRRELAGRGVIVRVDPKLGVLRLPEELLFDPGQAAMRPDATARLARLAAALLYFLPHLPQLEAVIVEGHTDDRPIAGPLYADNWDLAYHRAKATYQGLIAATPALGTLTNDRGDPVLGMGAYGPARPVAPNATAAGRRQNRRIDLRVVLAPAAPISVENGETPITPETP